MKIFLVFSLADMVKSDREDDWIWMVDDVFLYVSL